jgi:uncharacterized repeat protein (TIGR01451 family)
MQPGIREIVDVQILMVHNGTPSSGSPRVTKDLIQAQRFSNTPLIAFFGPSIRCERDSERSKCGLPAVHPVGGCLYFWSEGPDGRGIANDETKPNNSAYTVEYGTTARLDTNLTSAQMTPFLPNAGAGPKITAKFKAKIFGFGDVVVNDNSLTLYQISEPLLSPSSATAANPAPYGTNANGKPINDPIPDTLIDPSTGQVVSPPADGPSALLDKFTITKPDVSASLKVSISAPARVVPGGSIFYNVSISNSSLYPLNGTQVLISLPKGLEFDGDLDTHTTLQGRSKVVVTIGRIVPGEQRTVQVKARAAEGQAVGATLSTGAIVRSSTAQPVTASPATTTIGL